MNYIQNLNVNPSTIKVEDSVIFTLSNGSTYSGTIKSNSARLGYYVELRERSNSIIFHELGLHAHDFVRSIVGYSTEGGWPETHTLEDLSKVLEALLKVNKPEEPKIEEPEEKKSTPLSKWDWLLS